ncbi:MAG: hypothetical protein R2771_10185 [Saprospiraceae bacterium]
MAIIFILTSTACKQMNDKNTTEGLPAELVTIHYFRSSLQYQAPEFDKIKTEDFKPAFDYSLQEQMDQVNKIVNNNEEPDFDNTILALELSGENLTRANHIFFNLASANTSPELQQLEEEFGCS